MLRTAELTGGAFKAKPRQPIDPTFLITTKPASDRVDVDEQSLGELLEAQTIVQQHQSVHPARHWTAVKLEIARRQGIAIGLAGADMRA